MPLGCGYLLCPPGCETIVNMLDSAGNKVGFVSRVATRGEWIASIGQVFLRFRNWSWMP